MPSWLLATKTMSSRRRTPRPRRRSTSARILSSEPASRLKLKAITWSGAVIVALLALPVTSPTVPPSSVTPAGGNVPGAAARSFAAHPETGLAGRPPEQPLDPAALALGRTARATVPGSHRNSLLTGRWGRAVVDVARGGNRCADTLGDDLLDDHERVHVLRRAAAPHHRPVRHARARPGPR